MQQGSEEAGLTGLGWVGLVDQVYCRQMVEGRYGVLFIIVLLLQETPIVHCMYSIYEYAYSCVYSAAWTCVPGI